MRTTVGKKDTRFVTCCPMSGLENEGLEICSPFRCNQSTVVVVQTTLPFFVVNGSSEPVNNTFYRCFQCHATVVALQYVCTKRNALSTPFAAPDRAVSLTGQSACPFGLGNFAQTPPQRARQGFYFASRSAIRVLLRNSG